MFLLCFAVSILQIRWKGLRDCFKRYLRKLNDAQSGSATKRVVPYIHADELEFLRPWMDLRETQSSWEVPDEGQEESQAAASEEAASQEAEGSLDHSLLNDSEAAQESNRGEASASMQQLAQPIRLRSQHRSRPPRGRLTENMDRFALLVESMNQKLEELNSEDHGFGLMVAGMLQKIPQERKHAVKKAVMDLLEASIRNEPSIPTSPMFGPPPSGPYYTYPNPPPPRTHPYYPPRFRPYSDEYGNAMNPAHPPIPYPSPSPIPSTIGAPGYQQYRQNANDFPPTPSPSPSTSSVTSGYEPVYEQL
ncbi:hypothetical protein AB205_0107690 [Aquarana catesbeiana]|uniref:MADF domain-containing protein n=1 Tax=Aquarana catesbeiana TaxID=8400 RepID=A0A2G9QL18_AQUCT|nr:hypothetical protein AB205_0107690 [Aquarana catesbeiana]